MYNHYQLNIGIDSKKKVIFMKAEIIAEIGSNWEGNLTTARKIIRECKEAGADGVKFQMWRASDLYEKALSLIHI